ncbi:hypothetical protein J437_LFUL008890 [Ladona fulva]|uniref:Transposable element P transposase n=1 Tax=Ladona fulva TaxID=123851 RepID=A0A8K0KB87_LADFU|nr:hypothetical protein J437_LFUL008890 [Ladona fulva]
MIFDEMSIREHVQYECKGDKFLGLENLGSARGVTTALAKQALVFMVRGIVTSWKQPVAFYFTRDTMPSDVLVYILAEVLQQCYAAGLTVLSTVCDMAAKNVKPLRIMGATEKRPYLLFQEKKVVMSPISSNVRGICCIETHFYKLSERHLDPKGPDAMKVSLAAQILSHRMALCLTSCISSRKVFRFSNLVPMFFFSEVIPPSAIGTATVCGEMNKLFDSLNRVGRQPQGAKGMRRAICIDEEDLHLQFWSSTLQFFEGWRYYRRKFFGGNYINELFEPPSHRGWLQKIRGVIELWDILKSFNVSVLQLKWFNQNALENLFGLIRYNCGSNRNPTAMQFIAALKTCLLNGLVKRDLQHGNCEIDESEFMLNLREFVTQPTYNAIAPELKRKLSFAKVQCKGSVYCVASMTSTIAINLFQGGVQFKFDGVTLHPTEDFLKLVGNVATVTELVLNESAGTTGIKSRVLAKINSEINHEWVRNGCSRLP